MQENIIKVINATYRLLDFFPDGDPLKNKAKERVLLIMETLALDDVLMLDKYLELAKNMGWVNGINFLIVQKEWEIIRVSLKKVERIAEDVRPKQTTSNPFEVPQGKYSDRQNTILKILNRKETIQVQDIIKEMPNITKRTIRRDLDDLLKKGEIARIGEFNQVFYQKVDRTRFLS